MSFLGDETRFNVLHVVEPRYLHYSVDPTLTGSIIHSLEAEAMASTKSRVAELCAPFGIDEEDQHVVMGHTATEIHKFVTANRCDLILIGTHGRRGMQRLLGSTANAVVHGVPVDVYLCYIPPKGE